MESKRANGNTGWSGEEKVLVRGAKGIDWLMTV